VPLPRGRAEAGVWRLAIETIVCKAQALVQRIR
jgi:hypothetical protein